MDIVSASSQLDPDVYDKMTKTDSFELEDALKPMKGELPTQWQFRVNDFVNRFFKEKINGIQSDGDSLPKSSGTKWAKSMLTSGNLLKRVPKR